MSAHEPYRVEVRLKNGLKRYYLVREVNTDARKFAATHLIKSGAKPTKAEITRCISMFGFDLEMKCLVKVTKFRAEKFSFERYADEDEYFELERHRYLNARRPVKDPEKETAAHIAALARFAGVEITPAETARMFSSGEIPRGKRLFEVNVLQNLRTAYLQRETKERLGMRMVLRLQDVLHTNSETGTGSLAAGDELKKMIAGFHQRIREKSHPFEQCFLFYEAFSALFPDEALLSAELFFRMAAIYGYVVTPGTWEEMIAAVRSENADMELALRRSFEEMTKSKVGVRQKQLDFFG
ncbi:MAG: hypothetical protein PHF01_02795 [Methanocorpusculum sp.]|nr:hypothetical protein [Methanocorpusculum sp.]